MMSFGGAYRERSGAATASASTLPAVARQGQGPSSVSGHLRGFPVCRVRAVTVIIRQVTCA